MFRFSKSFILSPLLLPAFFLCACAWIRHEPQITVPVQQSALQQYKYALDHKEGVSLDLITDAKRLERARAIIRREYAMVPENFPDDRKYTPLAKLEVLEMDAGLDHRRAQASRSALREAIRKFEALRKAYPEYNFVQAKALFDEGLCHKKLREFPQAQACFKEVRDKFSKNPDDKISDLALSAQRFYNEVYVVQ